MIAMILNAPPETFRLTLSPAAPDWFKRVWLGQPDGQGQSGQIPNGNMPADLATPAASPDVVPA
jgi:hypothetical protein